MKELPSRETMLDWIATIVRQGIRRPGYPADAWTERWTAERFRELGLDVRLDPIEVPRWRPGRASLHAWLDADPARSVRVPGFPVPNSASSASTSGPLVRLADAGRSGAGFLALDEIALTELPQSFVRGLATGSYDPEDVFGDLTQTLPFGPAMQDVIEPAVAAGAAGYVGALTGFPWETREYYVPYDAKDRPIPGIWLSRSDALRVLGLLDAGPCTANLTALSDTGAATSHNVVATLPGNSDHWVIIGSHHDAPSGRTT